METYLLDVLRPVLGLILGAAIGLGFGLLQARAQRRYAKLQQDGALKNGWPIVPGSMARVAYLLIGLVVAQVISPALFAGASAWWVSGGVAAGYGTQLFLHFRQHRAALAMVPARHL
jgi:hypothetical protein